MIKNFKAHPLMIITFLKPFLVFLLLPVINGIRQYIQYKTYDSILGAELFLLTVITVIAIFRWRTFLLICNTENNTITIKRGLLFKRRATIAISKLSSVQAARGPLDAIFRSVTYRINTEAGASTRPDFEFKMSSKNSKELSSILYGKNEVAPVKFPAIKVAILAATTSSAFTGIIVGVPVLNRAGKLLGIAISDMLFNEINNVSSKIQTYFPPIVNTISLIILISYFFSFVYSFLKFVNFKLFLNDKNIEVRSGFFIRRRTSFRKSAINDIRIEQTPIMLLLRRFAMKVSVGGYGDGKGESEVIIPLENDNEMKKRIADYFPFLMTDKSGITPKKDYLTQSRFLFWPAIFLMATIALAIILSLRFTDFTRFIFFSTFTVCVLIFCRAYLGLFEYYKGTIRLGDNIFCRSNRGFRTCEIYCPKEKVGEIIITRFPTDLIYKTCRVKVSVRSERADSLRIRNIDYETAKKQIYNCFNIE